MYQHIAIKKKGKTEHRYEQKREGNARTIGTERTETGQLDVWLQPAWPKAVRDGRERARDGESRSRKGSSMRPNANKSFLTLLFWDPGPHLFRGELGGKRGGGTPPGLARLQPALPHARSFCALSRSHGPSGSELASSSEVSGVQCCSTFARKWPPSPPARLLPSPAGACLFSGLVSILAGGRPSQPRRSGRRRPPAGKRSARLPPPVRCLGPSPRLYFVRR